MQNQPDMATGENPLPPLTEFQVRYPLCTFKPNTPHTFTVDATYGKYEVKVSPSTGYGYFENSLHGGEGGLWFDHGELVDFDGFSELPKDVKAGLKAAGFIVGDEF